MEVEGGVYKGIGRGGNRLGKDGKTEADCVASWENSLYLALLGVYRNCCYIEEITFVNWKDEEQRMKKERLDNAQETIEKLKEMREQEKERLRLESSQVQSNRDDQANLEGVNLTRKTRGEKS